MNAREVIERLSKDELVDLVLEYSDNGYFPLEPFLLKSDYAFTRDNLKNICGKVHMKKPGNMRIRKVILAQIY